MSRINRLKERLTSGSNSNTKSNSSTSSGDSGSSDRPNVEPTVSAPVEDVSPDPGFDGGRVQEMAEAGGSEDGASPDELAGEELDRGTTSENTEDASSEAGAASAPSRMDGDRLEAPRGGSGAGGGSSDSRGSSDGSSEDQPASSGPVQNPDGGTSGSQPAAGDTNDTGGNGGAASSDSAGGQPASSGPAQRPGGDTSGAGNPPGPDAGRDFDPRPDQYRDETSVGSTEREREVRDVVTGDASGRDDAVAIDEQTVEEIDQQFPNADITASDLQYTSNELQLTEEAREEVRRERRSAARVSSGGQFGEQRLEEEIEADNPGVDVDVGRSADGSFAVDVVDTPDSGGDQWVSSGGRLGEQLRREEAEQEARDQLAQQVDSEFENANLERGEDFTIEERTRDGEVVFEAELTEQGRKEVATSNAPLADVPGVGRVTQAGAAVNWEYEEFRRGLHDQYDDLASPAQEAWNENTPDTQEWWNENTPDVDTPSARDILAGSAAAVAAPEPTSSASGAAVGAATLAGLGVASLGQNPDENETTETVTVDDPSEIPATDTPPEDVTEIDPTDTPTWEQAEVATPDTAENVEVQEVEPGDPDVQEVDVPADGDSSMMVVETGAATGTDTGTGTGPGENPFEPDIGTPTPGVDTGETVEDDANNYGEFVDQQDDWPGTVTEGELGRDGGLAEEASEPMVDAPASSEIGQEAVRQPEVGVDTTSTGWGGAQSDSLMDSETGLDSLGLGEGLGNVGAGVNVDAANIGSTVTARQSELAITTGSFAVSESQGFQSDFPAMSVNQTVNESQPFQTEFTTSFGRGGRRPRLGMDGDGDFDTGSGFDVSVGSESGGGGVAANWFNETAATSATVGTMTFTPDSDQDGLFGAPVDTDSETRDEIDTALEFFEG